MKVTVMNLSIITVKTQDTGNAEILSTVGISHTTSCLHAPFKVSDQRREKQNTFLTRQKNK